MKFVSGAMVGDLSGSLGSTTASRNRYGSYFRSRVIPVNPSSPRQVIIRNRYAYLTNYWNEILTEDERSSWRTYALNTPLQGHNGTPVTVTGFNMFLRSNTAVLEASVAVTKTAPGLFTLPETDPTILFTASEASQNLSVSFDNTLGWANEVGGKLLLYLGNPQVNNRNFFGGPWRYAGLVSGGSSPPTSPATVASPYTLTQNQKVWLYARVLRADGRLSGSFRCGPVTVGA